MSVSDSKETVPQGFDNPIALPRTPDQERQWQEANRTWWESHPMRYDFSSAIQAEEFSREFYREIDERFFADVRTFMPWREIPFDPLIDFASLRDKDVLEIGVGNGSHAQLISSYPRSYTGIDLTEYAVRSTNLRLRHFNGDKPNVKVLQMDAEKMEFSANSFDLIWSWGVIHHSANTRRIVEQIHRVLRPGGVAITMVYHRNIWNYYIFAGLFGGVFRGSFLRSWSWHKARQQMIDGAIARYYSIAEWQTLVSDLFSVEDMSVFGSKSELIPLPSGKLKAVAKVFVPNSVGRLLTNHCKLGMFLVSTLRKAAV
ncbi:MAG TPA: methyltransferase domain-containing protein [Pyrinomonadaceae bacterium]|nr:methyltransferase domain-containing protein [Pyrinomonadaceae bacterium]